ncbi:photosystem reaction center subunit H [Burkholderia sp. WAC0059]|uniref:PRC-barrel domain-containing protein n=1 Tax=Burkholderia sp. WAC0059 TaxID=2066022 RepID=UPI000C7F2FFB|nr:PRC-barrel domain-containing protein [Burkholderia sp. WAC0059]PLZ04369.1 photosystem reaction center subunit H [Burkholderia sp. WAC0059]
MRGGFSRPAAGVRGLVVLLFAALSGCSLFRPPPPPAPPAPPPVVASAPEVASAPVVAPPPPVVASAPEVEPRPAPRHIWHPRLRRRRPAPPRPAPRPPAPSPLPAPIIETRELERAGTRTLLDSKVQKPDGKVVGRAVDLVADPDGRPVAVVVNLQGFMGIGDRKARFPWNVVRINTEPKTPAITLMLAPNQQPSPDRPGPGTPQPGPEPATSTRLPMLDTFVERANGSRVGRVVDVVLDGAANPQAVVLDVSGIMQTRRMIAADWSALHFVTKNKVLEAQLELSDAQVNASPPYTANEPVQAVSPVVPKAPAAAAHAHGAQ